MTNGSTTFLTPNLARVLGALALLVAVFFAGMVARDAIQSQAPGLHAFNGSSDEINSIGGDHRLIRTSHRGNANVVCSEGPKQLQYVAKPASASESSASPAALSTVYLREAGWQICSAYANGVINEAKYAELLTALISKPVPVAAAPRSRSKTRARTPRHRQKRGR